MKGILGRARGGRHLACSYPGLCLGIASLAQELDATISVFLVLAVASDLGIVFHGGQR